MSPSRIISSVVTPGVLISALCLSGTALAAICNVPADHATIQGAADDMTCNEIVIAAGTYTEQVTVGRMGSIYVHGAGAGRTIIKAPATRVQSALATNFHPNYTYVIQVPNGLAADFANFTVEGGSNLPCGEDFYGIRFNNSTGSVDSIVVQGAMCPVGVGFGLQAGVGIAAVGDMGIGSASLTVLRSTVRNFQKVGVLINGPTASGSVQNTYIHGVGPQQYIAQNGVQFSRGATAAAIKNKIDNLSYTGDTCGAGMVTQVSSGIITYQSAVSLLQQNIILNVDRGIELNGNTSTQTVTDNRIINSYSGINSESNSAGVVRISTNSLISETKSPAINVATCFTDSGNGITVQSESGTTVIQNAGSDNVRDGIEIRSTASGTDNEQNRLTRSTVDDIVSADATATTANNVCRTSSPAGLCALSP